MSNAKDDGDSFYPDAAAGGLDDDNNEKEYKIERNQGALFQKSVLAIVLLVGILGLLELLTTQEDHDNGIRNGLLHTMSLPTTTPVKNKSMMMAAAAEPESEVARRVEDLDAKVRQHKQTKGIMMEIDPMGLELTKQLQHATHKLLVTRYGRHAAYRVVVNLTFQPSIPDYATKGSQSRIVIEMAPIDLLPVSVFNFLEIARTWKSGAVHRNAGHVLQVQARSAITESMPFQEYSPEFPHRKGTTGYAGRPSGPGWYISIQDNSQNHGPGSQQKANPHEADSCFGRVVQGLEDVVPRIHSTPQTSWLDKENMILIPSMQILVADNQGNFVPWEPASSTNR